MSEKCILVVDDDKELTELIVSYLEDEGFLTMHAGNGDMAFNHIVRTKPDLILVNIHLSSDDGLQVCRTLKAHPTTADIPIVIVTGNTSFSNRLAGYLAGAMRYIAKPFELGELGDCVRGILSA